MKPTLWMATLAAAVLAAARPAAAQRQFDALDPQTLARAVQTPDTRDLAGPDRANPADEASLSAATEQGPFRTMAHRAESTSVHPHAPSPHRVYSGHAGPHGHVHRDWYGYAPGWYAYYYRPRYPSHYPSYYWYGYPSYYRGYWGAWPYGHAYGYPASFPHVHVTAYPAYRVVYPSYTYYDLGHVGYGGCYHW